MLVRPRPLRVRCAADAGAALRGLRLPRAAVAGMLGDEALDRRHHRLRTAVPKEVILALQAFQPCAGNIARSQWPVAAGTTRSCPHDGGAHGAPRSCGTE